MVTARLHRRVRPGLVGVTVKDYTLAGAVMVEGLRPGRRTRVHVRSETKPQKLAMRETSYDEQTGILQIRAIRRSVEHIRTQVGCEFFCRNGFKKLKRHRSRMLHVRIPIDLAREAPYRIEASEFGEGDGVSLAERGLI